MCDMDNTTEFVSKLLSKSQEAFLLAIEIYNKPSIRYRVEGFSFFICNAWELMLKAHLVKTRGESSIYYKDNPDRTITLENCVKEIFTNERTPLRKNLFRIVELRNTSTHLIVEEYEMVYIPLFQACVFNFVDKMQDFHGIDMTTVIPSNFLTLTVSMSALNAEAVKAKYPGQISGRLLSASEAINADADASNSGFAIRIRHEYYITKDRSEATDFLCIDRNAPVNGEILKEIKDVNGLYPYNAKKSLKEIKARLKRNGVDMLYNGAPTDFNSYHFNLFTKYYHLKEDSRYCYPHKQYEKPTYTYSIQAIDFIVGEIKKDPEHIIQNLKKQLGKK